MHAFLETNGARDMTLVSCNTNSYNNYSGNAGITLTNSTVGDIKLTGSSYTNATVNGVASFATDGTLQKNTVATLSATGVLTTIAFRGPTISSTDDLNGFLLNAGISAKIQFTNSEYKGLSDRLCSHDADGVLKQTTATLSAAGVLGVSSIKTNNYSNTSGTANISIVDSAVGDITFSGSKYGVAENGKILSLQGGVLTPINVSGTQGSYTGFKVKQGTDSNVITLDVFKTNNKITISFPELTVPSVSANTDPIISLNMDLTNFLQPSGLYTFPVIINDKSAYVKFTYDTPNTTWYLSFINYVAWDAGTNVIQPFTITYTCLNTTTPANTVWGTVYSTLITNLITPTLTSNTSDPNFLVSASSEFSVSYPTWHIFDGTNNSWGSLGGRYDGAGVATASDIFTPSGGVPVNGAWVRVSMDQTYKFNYYKLGQNSGTDENPVDFTLYGSNSVADNTFTVINQQTGYSLVGTNGVFNPNISVGTQQFRYLVFQVNKTSGATGSCNLREMVFGWI